MVSLKSFKSIDLVDEKQHYATPLTPTIQNTKILSTNDQQQVDSLARLVRYNQNSNYQAPQFVELTDQQDKNILPKTSKHKTTQHLQDTSNCQDFENEGIKVNGKRVNCKRATSAGKVLFGSKKMSTVVEDVPIVASAPTTSSSSTTTSHIQNKDAQQTVQITDDNQASDARQLSHKNSIHKQAINLTNNHNANSAEVQSTTKDSTSSSISIIVVNHDTAKTGTAIETAVSICLDEA